MNNNINKSFKIKLFFLLFSLLFIYSCGECKSYFIMPFENTLESDIEIHFRSDNIYYGEAPVTHIKTLPANESVDIVLQSTKVNANGMSDCEDLYFNRGIEISNDSLSMYTFCVSGNKHGASQKVRVLEISSNCLINETKIMSGY